MPLSDRVGYVWMDGCICQGSEAQTSVLSYSLHYGMAVFEGIRVYEGRAFLAFNHINRLFESAILLGYKIPYSFDQIIDSLNLVISKNKLYNAYVRVIAWLGDESLGLASGDLSVHVAIAAWPWEHVHKLTKTDPGIAVCKSNKRRPSAATVPPNAKASGGYLIGAIAYREAKSRGFDEAIVCDSEGKLAEATTANIFFVRDGTLCTPVAEGFLNGITRQTVLVLARELGIKCDEGNFSLSDLDTASEIFITGTAVEIQAVTRIENKTLTKGNVTKRISARYSDIVRDDCESFRIQNIIHSQS